MKNSKLPWRYDNYGTGIMATDIGGCKMEEDEFRVCDIRGWGHLQYLGEEEGAAIQEANAEYIVKSANAYPGLVAALKNYTLDYAEEILKELGEL